MGGTNTNFYLIKQTPILNKIIIDKTIKREIESKTLHLLFTDISNQSFARNLGYDGPPFRWDLDERAHLMAELDAIVAHLYGVTYDELDYILETFPIVKRKDIAESGEYKTKRLILENYNKYMDITEAAK